MNAPRTPAIAQTQDTEPRATCWRCRRPQSHCLCALIPSVSSKTRVIFVQHPRESDTAIGTARMAHLALTGSQLIEGVAVDDAPALQEALASPDALVLFPSEDALPLAQAQLQPPQTLIVIDGTWPQARSILRHSPRLAAKGRLAFVPEAPGNYRIRKEPAAHCVATVEAVAAVLGALEGDVDRFKALLRPFDALVDRQIDAAQTHKRHRFKRRTGPGPLKELLPVHEGPQRAVLLYAEPNTQPIAKREPGAPELLHLVAVRPATGERLSLVLAPRRRLFVEVAERIGVPAAAFADGLAVDEAHARIRAFLGDDGILCLWGQSARDLLTQEGFAHRGFIDLRALCARALGTSPQGLHRAPEAFGHAFEEDGAAPRADRMLARLAWVHAELLRRLAADLQPRQI